MSISKRYTIENDYAQKLNLYYAKLVNAYSSGYYVKAFLKQLRSVFNHELFFILFKKILEEYISENRKSSSCPKFTKFAVFENLKLQ